VDRIKFKEIKKANLYGNRTRIPPLPLADRLEIAQNN